VQEYFQEPLLTEKKNMTHETFVSAQSNSELVAYENATIGDVLFELRRISATLAAQSSAVMGREDAANYIGVTVATLDELAKANPTLRPVAPVAGVEVFRRADLDAFVESLEQ
jgi:hypothetical protein